MKIIHFLKNTIRSLFLVTLSLLLVSCSLTSTNENDSYLNIPDPNFEKILIALDIDTEGSLDGQVLRADVEKVRVLDLNIPDGNFEIQDMTGIEGFVNLSTLKAIQHEIEFIDLRSNTMLDSLYLQGNLLQEIDLSLNTNLVNVNLSTNEIYTIDGLTELNKLKELDLSWNFMETFSISNASLEILFLNLNELQTLDVSEAENLKALNLTTNNLTDLSVSSNTQLETLVISNNNLKQIELSQNPELKYLYASTNAFTNLDVSQNQKLVDLRVDRNPSLSCINIEEGQEILTVRISDYQEIRSDCGV
ncbi:hypothetical protein A8B79_02565 [Balneola sp. EhC07]|uniref:hypothetical protein n=1 Tax=Balneola sp. EhC07 TaxID=1849360 RepID=UPI0007F3443B|nr:hypothetical protein [Balneola sp. EhC07]OAN62627.1 hypothetical protein A8B79_02565 [Balneola sp. EhC07]